MDARNDTDRDFVAGEIGRLYQSDANVFALKVETREGEHVATKWLTISHRELGRIWGVFADGGGAAE